MVPMGIFLVLADPAHPFSRSSNASLEHYKPRNDAAIAVGDKNHSFFCTPPQISSLAPEVKHLLLVWLRLSHVESCTD